MTRRFPTFVALASVAALTAACAGGASGGATGMGESAVLRTPVVDDPAPIVSGTMRRYQVRGQWYQPREQPNYDERGMASWYGPGFHGRRTATGETFDQNALTAAHKTLPLPGLVEITNTANGRRIVARLNDRGPFADNRLIDLSRGSAEALGLIQAGVGEVRVRYLGPAPRLGGGATLHQASLGDGPRLRGPVPYEQAVRNDPDPPVIVAAQVAPQLDLRPAIPAASSAGLFVLAGAFDDARNARRAAERLGAVARVESADRGLYRVVVGPWPDPAAAERSRRAVMSRGFPDALLISAP